jgi:hypothetical protein
MNDARTTDGDVASAHAMLIAENIKRFLDRPAPPQPRLETPQPPPGAPIGEPALDWIRRLEPACSVDGETQTGRQFPQ